MLMSTTPAWDGLHRRAPFRGSVSKAPTEQDVKPSPSPSVESASPEAPEEKDLETGHTADMEDEGEGHAELMQVDFF